MSRSIEDKYRDRGSWTDIIYDNGNVGLCDSQRAPTKPCTLVYSSNLAEENWAHPLVVLGIGANFTSVPDPVCQYRPLLEHLASWGLVGVAPNDSEVGDGTSMISAVQTVLSLNRDPSSPLHNRIATNRIAALGHSLGAEGAVNAAVHSPGLLTSVVIFGLSRRFLYREPALADVTAPILFVRGSDVAEEYLSPEWVNQVFFDSVSGPAAKATVCGDMWHKTGNCADGIGGQHISPFNAMGYLVAWLLYTLAGDSEARSVFVGSPPEIATNQGWRNWQSKDLP